MWRDFKAFLVKQNALALAIGVVVGGALDTVVKALVNGIIMPLVAPLQAAAAGDYAKLQWTVGPFRFAPGLVLAAAVNFLVIGFVAWRLSKFFIKETPSSPVKTCPVCFKSDLDERARRCPYCQSEIGAGQSGVPATSPAPALAAAR